MTCTHLPGYLIEYDTARYPPRLCPSSIIDSRPTLALHCSIDSTNCSSAFSASVENRGLLLCPKPSRSRAKMGRCGERASKLWAQRPTPHPNPWSNTMGVLSLTWELVKVRVHRQLPLEIGTYCFEKVLFTPAKKGMDKEEVDERCRDNKEKYQNYFFWLREKWKLKDAVI